MRTSESIVNILKARVQAKKALKSPKKDGLNPHFKSKYITFESLISCITEAMEPHGLDMYVQLLNHEDGNIGCEISLYHISGEYIRTEPFFLPCTQKTSQAYGAASTYVQRYAISSFWGIAAALEDDDGHSSSTPINVPNSFSKKNVGPVSAINRSLPVGNPHRRKEIISKIRETFFSKEVDLKAQAKWLDERYQVSSFEELDEIKLLSLLERVTNLDKK